MSRKKKPVEEWIEVNDAAAIISKNSGRDVSPDYVRLLGHKGKISMKPKDKRTNLYLKSDVEVYRVARRGKQHEAKPEETIA